MQIRLLLILAGYGWMVSGGKRFNLSAFLDADYINFL